MRPVLRSTRSELDSGEFLMSLLTRTQVSKTPDEYKDGMVHTRRIKESSRMAICRGKFIIQEVINRQGVRRMAVESSGLTSGSAMVINLIKAQLRRTAPRGIPKDTGLGIRRKDYPGKPSRGTKRKYRNSVYKYGEYMRQKGEVE